MNKKICRQLGVRSILAIPLRSTSAIIGVAQAFYARPNGFSAANVADLEGSADLFVSCLRPAGVAEEKRPALLVNSTPVNKAVGMTPAVGENVERWSLQGEIAPMAWAQPQQPAWWNRPGMLMIVIAAIFALLWIAWLQSAPELSSAPATEPAKHLEDAAPPTGSDSASGMVAPLAKQALSGDADAQFLLARHYESGNGIPQSLPLAYSWYTLAAEAGNSVARQAVRSLTPKLSTGEIAAIRRNVGNMYATGVGVRQRDYIAAYAWLSLAEAGGEPRAKKDRDYLAVAMTPQEIAAAKQRASSLLKRHGYANPEPRRINNR